VKAVILSAGQGKRLLPLTEDLPKCLLNVDVGTTILGWQIEQLAAAGVDDIVVVTGFRTDMVEAEVERLTGPDLRLQVLYNPFFGVADNLGSVWVARRAMTEDFILLNGDTLFDASVAGALLAASAAPITVVVSHKESYDADDMKVHLSGGRLAAVGKTLPADKTDGESIGMMLFRGGGVAAFGTAVDQAMRTEPALRLWYLSVIDALSRERPIATVAAERWNWCEVDFPADLQRAREAIARWRNDSDSADLAAIS